MTITKYRPCVVDGCSGAVKARDLCNAHWRRWRRHGDPTAGGTAKGELRSFLANHLSVDHDDCVLWPFTTAGNGYGKLWLDGSYQFAHRVMCTMAHGEPPTPTHHAAHSCGRGHVGCISPRHLSWKTSAENNADKALHGTVNHGAANGMAKLTADEVREIRALRGQMPKPEIASRFGVSTSAIQDIFTGRRWSALQT